MKQKLPITKPTAPERKRVLIVDDHPFLRVGLTESIAKEPGLCVCGAVATAEEALTAVEKQPPDVVVADLNLPGKSGLELIKDLASLRPGLPVIVLSMHEEEIFAERCLRAGARGYLMKNEGPATLAAAIRHVLAGGIHVSKKASASLVETFASQRRVHKMTPPLSRLSDREFEVFRLIGQGLSTQDIASRLHIGAKTIETHRMNLKRKLRLTTAAALVAYAARWLESAGGTPAE